MGNFLSFVICRPAIRPLPLNTGSTALGQSFPCYSTHRGQSLYGVNGDQKKKYEKRAFKDYIKK